MPPSLRLLFAVLVLACILAPSVAHQPRMVDGDEITVQRPEVSQAFYAELHGRAQVYRFQSDTPFILYVQLTLPDLPGVRKDYTVRVLRDDQPAGQLTGADAAWKPFYEPFGGDHYLLGPELRQAQAPAGHYTAEVSAPGFTGKYVLAIGEKEAFTPADWKHALAVLPAVKAFMGTPMPPAAPRLFNWAVLLSLFFVRL